MCFTCGDPLTAANGVPSAAGSSLGQLPEYRHPLFVFILTLVTADFYRVYWNYTITREVQECLKEEITDPAMTVMAFLGSCGLYDMYWDWVFSKKIAKMMDLAGLEPVDYSWLFLFLNLTVVGRLAIPALMQVNLNDISQTLAWQANAAD